MEYTREQVEDIVGWCFKCYATDYRFDAVEKAREMMDRLDLKNEKDWLPFEGNKLLFNEEAKKNCLCKFDDGTVIRYNEEHPWAIMTHFKKA